MANPKLGVLDLAIESWGKVGLFFAFGVLVVLSTAASVFFNSQLILALPALILGVAFYLYRFKSLFYALFAVLPYSVEISVGSGLGTDFPSEPVMMILMLGFLLLLYLRKNVLRWSLLGHPLTLLLLFHLGWIFITALHSEMFLVSFKFWLAKTWYYTVFVFLAAYFIRSWKDFEPLFWLLVIALGIATVYVLVRHSQFNFHFEHVNKSMWPIFRNHVNYAVMLAMLVPYLLMFRKNYRAGGIERLILDGLMVLYVIGIFFSYTRAAYISVVAIPLVYLIIRWKLVLPTVVVSMIAACAFFFWMSHDNRYLDFGTTDDTQYHKNWDDHLTATVELKDISTMERFYRWIAGFRMLEELPVAGYGPSTFYHLYKPYTVAKFKTYVSENEEKSTVHNYYLMVILEQGWIGFLFFMSILLYFLIKGQVVYHRLTKIEEKRMLMAGLISSILIFLNLLMADFIEVDKIGPFFFLHIAILINFDIDSRKEGNVLYPAIEAES